jgi:hypothetical protein
MEYVEVSVIQSRETRGVKPKIKGRKINSVYWQGALKRKKLKRCGALNENYV